MSGGEGRRRKETEKGRGSHGHPAVHIWHLTKPTGHGQDAAHACWLRTTGEEERNQTSGWNRKNLGRPPVGFVHSATGGKRRKRRVWNAAKSPLAATVLCSVSACMGRCCCTSTSRQPDHPWRCVLRQFLAARRRRRRSPERAFTFRASGAMFWRQPALAWSASLAGTSPGLGHQATRQQLSG